MKGIIVELRGHYAALLTEDGCVVKVMNHHYQIGQEVILMNKSKLKSFAALASAASLLLVAGLSSYAYFDPYTTVSLDVNPSIEFTANRFDRVLSAKGMNEDGQELLQNMESVTLNNKSIDEALELTIREMTKLGYLSQENSQIYIGTVSKQERRAETLALTLKEDVESELAEQNSDASVSANAIGRDRVLRARALGVTPGKLNLAEKLVEQAGSDTTIRVEDWIGKSVNQILEETNRYREQNRISEKNEYKEASNPSISENKATQVSGNKIKKKTETRKRIVSENNIEKDNAQKNTLKNNVGNKKR